MQARAAVEHDDLGEIDLVTYFEALRRRAAHTTMPAHRRMLRNYVLQSLLIVSGRPDRIAEEGLLAADAQFKFLDTDRACQGADAILAFLASEVAAGTHLNLPVIGRIASADWGFSAEQVDNVCLSVDVVRRLALAVPEASAWFVRRRPNAVVRTFDMQGRMTAQREYPSERESLACIVTPAFADGVAHRLDEVIEKARREFAENPDGLL